MVIAVLVTVKLAGGAGNTTTVRTAVAPDALRQVAAIPVSTLVAAAEAAPAGTVNPPSDLPPSVPDLSAGAKPEILYMGAEYCPFCAAERWPMVMALSKFGTFSSLASTKSSSTDTNPDTPTFSFYGSSYSSPYLAFTAVELYDRAGKTLQIPTAEQSKLIGTYDAPPYTTGAKGAIPFVYLGGRYLISGEEYNAADLSGMTFDSAVGYMTGGSSATSRAAEAVAGHLVGVICSLTKDRPANVCSAVPQALKSGQATSANQGATSAG
ncbi:MAG: DUF929 family protein [Acidimicrobiales bacterium]